MSVLEKFKASQPKEFVYGRISKFTQAPETSKDKLYLWKNFVDRVFEEKAVDYLIKDIDEKCAFLWQPSVKNFWDYVKQHELVIYDYISPALRGLLLEPSCLWVPRAVVYDVDAAFELYQSTYRDSALSAKKRYLRQLEEFNELLRYNSGNTSPWFVRNLLSKNTLPF